MFRKFLCIAAVLAAGSSAFAQEGIALGLSHNANTIRYATQDHISQYGLVNGWGTAYRTGCNTGCTTGCDTGCTTGCDTDCTAGCDTGCTTGCNVGCGKGSWLSGKKVWVNWVTRENSLNDFKTRSNGVQVGFDIYADKTTLIGLVGGYEDADLEANGADVANGDDYYFGIYGSKLFRSCIDMRVYAGYGDQKFDAAAARIADGQTFETTIEFGRRYMINRCLSFRPFVGLDWYYNDVDTANLADSAQMNQVMSRIGTDVQYSRGQWNVNGGLHYAYQLNSHALDTLSNAVADLAGIDLGRSVLTLTAGTTVYLDKCKDWSVFATYYGDCYTDRTSTPWQHTGLIGMGYRF